MQRSSLLHDLCLFFCLYPSSMVGPYTDAWLWSLINHLTGSSRSRRMRLVRRWKRRRTSTSWIWPAGGFFGHPSRFDSTVDVLTGSLNKSWIQILSPNKSFKFCKIYEMTDYSLQKIVFSDSFYFFLFIMNIKKLGSWSILIKKSANK